jgi:hypothetical protein
MDRIPSPSQQTTSPQVRQLIADGLDLFKDHRLNAAMELWKQALKLSPFNREALFYLQHACIEKDQKRIVAGLLGMCLQAFKKQLYRETLVHALMIRGIDPLNKKAYKLFLMAKDGLRGELTSDLGYYNQKEREFRPEDNKRKKLTESQTSIRLPDTEELTLDHAIEVAREGEVDRALAIVQQCQKRPTIPESVIRETVDIIKGLAHQEIRESLPNLTVYAIPTGLKPEQSDIADWELENLYLYSLINGQRTLQTLCGLVSRPLEGNLNTLHRFSKSGIIRIVEKNEQQT